MTDDSRGGPRRQRPTPNFGPPPNSASVPLTCKACGHTKVGGYLTSGAMLQINSWTCTECGHRNSGTYEVVHVGGQLQVALHDRSIQQLLQLRAVLRGKLLQHPERATLGDDALRAASAALGQVVTPAR